MFLHEASALKPVQKATGGDGCQDIRTHGCLSDSWILRMYRGWGIKDCRADSLPLILYCASELI